MLESNLQLKVLTKEQVGTIYEKCLDFLSNKGIKVTHQEGLRIFDQAGAQVDFDNHQVRFSRDIVEEALSSVPREFILASCDGQPDLPIPHPDGLFYRLGLTGAPEYLKPGSNTTRDVTLDDVTEWAQLLQALKGISLCATPFPTDAPLEIADICGIKRVFENSTKHVMCHPYSYGSLEYLIELGKVVAGGNEALRQKPLISMIICSVPPFLFKDMDIEGIILSARAGVPMHLFPLPLMAASAPVTVTGTILQNGIEILAMLVMSQLVEPGAKVFGAPFAFALDMVSGRNLQESVATIMANAGSVQFVNEAFHIPTHNEPGTDSHIPDGHAQVEKSLSGLMVSRAGADILGGAGQLDVIRVMSPLQLIIDDALVSVFERLNSPVKTDDENLAWQEILDIEPGGAYLELRHTLKHCRETLRPELLATWSRDTWVSKGSKDLHARALDKYQELKKTMKPLDLPAEVHKGLNEVESQARKQLVK
ncbi:trimethylamine methyltransferase family protein [Chloroflexota bacterium]